jgi:hypothetical protein
MKSVICGIILALVCSCTNPPPQRDDQKIQGFGSLKLGQSLQDAKTALEKDSHYYSFNGRTLDYETLANGDRWYVSALMVKSRISSITVAPRPIVAGGPAMLLSDSECTKRFDQTLESLRREYGPESSGPSSDGAGTDDTIWISKDRSITVHRHKVETGCDGLSVSFADFTLTDHF